jgi:hypothetical protein
LDKLTETKGEKTMKNIETKIEGTILTVKIDLSKNQGPSRTGKSILIASTEGNSAISPGVFMGVNVYRKN